MVNPSKSIRSEGLKMNPRKKDRVKKHIICYVKAGRCTQEGKDRVRKRIILWGLENALKMKKIGL